MGTTATYNGVTFSNVLIRTWNQQIVYDPSDTDALFSRFSITLEGVVHIASSATVETVIHFNDGANTAADTHIANEQGYVRMALMQPRKPLLIMWDGNPAMNVEPAGEATVAGRIDVENGPKPRAFQIVALYGSHAMKVRWSVDVALTLCLTGTAGMDAAPFVLNNRWSISETMDANWYITRNIVGRMKFAKGRASSVDSAPAFYKKYLVVPALEVGFRRTGIEYTVNESGLDATYRVTDTQCHTAPPWPATDIQCVHKEETTENGCVFNSNATVRLDGPPGVDQRYLIERAVQCLDARLKISELDPSTDGGVFLSGAITVYTGTGTNAVEITGSVLRNWDDAQANAILKVYKGTLGTPLVLPGTLAGEPVAYDRQVAVPPPIHGLTPAGDASPRGTEGLVSAILQCYLQDRCNAEVGHQIPQVTGVTIPDTVSGSGEGETPPSPGDDANVNPDAGTEDAPSYAPTALPQVYTLIRLSNSYRNDDMKVAMPIAAASSAGADTMVLFTLSRGQCYRDITFEAEAGGGWPWIPHPVETWEEGTLKGYRLKTELNPQPPQVNANTTTLFYRVGGKYTYVLNRQPTAAEKLRTGALPTTKYVSNDDAVKFDQAASYKRDIGP